MIYTEENIESTVGKYDIFICGSDVIWNAGIPSYVSCLGFVPKEYKKIAYAPSIGISKLPNGWMEEYGIYLKKLDAVSVREESVRECLKSEMLELDIKTVADPVFLFSKEDWERELNKAYIKEKYVFCYLLGSSRIQRKEINKWAKKNGLKIITFPYIEHNVFRKCDIDFGDEKDYESDSIDFLNLLKNAEIVITDSFHAVAFSLIFHTDFRALYRYNGEKKVELTGRIQNLLKEVKMEDMLIEINYIEKIKLIDKQNYDYSDFILSEKKRTSREYLLQNIGPGLNHDGG